VNKFQPRRRLLSLLASVLDAAREAVFFTLTIPSLNPSIRTHGSEDFLEVITRGIVFTLDFLASMEVQVALVTVPGLVLVGESWVNRGSPEFRHDGS